MRIELGTTLSQKELQHRGIGIEYALKEFRDLRLKWLRVAVYWDESEAKPGEFDFSSTDQFVKFGEQNNINIVLCLGMRAPRHPEYYLPEWLTEQHQFKKGSTFGIDNQQLLAPTLRFLRYTTQHYKEFSCIKIWQIENEPLDRDIANHWQISAEFLQCEVETVRKIDPTRKTMVNVWANELTRRGAWKDATAFADIVGLDLYPRTPNPIPVARRLMPYIGSLNSPQAIQDICGEIRKAGKGVAIAELQAEIWEATTELANSDNPPSFPPRQLEKNIEYGLQFNPQFILLWGLEYWVWRKMQGDNRYIEAAKRVIEKYTT